MTRRNKTRKVPTRTPKTKKFIETRLGYLMAHEVPIEYEYLMTTTKMMKMNSPNPLLIENIAYLSGDLFFKKDKFWRCFNNYKKDKLKPSRRVITNVVKELYYIRLKYKKYLL